MKLILLLFLCFLTVNDSFSQNRIEHPERDRIPYINLIESENADGIASELLSPINQRLTKSSLKLEIGQTNNVLLGSVREVKVFNSTELIVLDSRGKQVTLLDRTSGSVIDNIGRAGQGPGEYENPYSIELDGDDLYVADRSFSINKFTHNEDAFEAAKEFKINIVPDQICILQDEVFIRGTSNNSDFNGIGKIVHVYDKKTLTYKRSIVNSYTAEGTIGVNELSEGQLHCDKETNSVILSFDILPYIYSFSTDGSLNWASGISGFQSRVVVEETGLNTPLSVTYKGDKMYDRVTGFTDIYDNILLVQSARSYPRSENRIPTLSSYAIDKRSGRLSLVNSAPDNWIIWPPQKMR